MTQIDQREMSILQIIEKLFILFLLASKHKQKKKFLLSICYLTRDANFRVHNREIAKRSRNPMYILCRINTYVAQLYVYLTVINSYLCAPFVADTYREQRQHCRENAIVFKRRLRILNSNKLHRLYYSVSVAFAYSLSAHYLSHYYSCVLLIYNFRVYS